MVAECTNIHWCKLRSRSLVSGRFLLNQQKLCYLLLINLSSGSFARIIFEPTTTSYLGDIYLGFVIPGNPLMEESLPSEISFLQNIVFIVMVF